MLSLAFVASAVVLGCSSSDDDKSASSSGTSASSSGGVGDAGSSGSSGSMGTSTSSSSGASSGSSSSGMPANAVGSIEVTLDGKPIELKGETSVFLSNNSSLLTFFRNSFAGERDPESTEPFSTISVIFEKTSGLKPFVLPDTKNSQNRRALLDDRGIQYRTEIANAKTKSDTFKYENGRITGVWTFDAPAGSPTQPIKEVVVTVDVAVPESVR